MKDEEWIECLINFSQTNGNVKALFDSIKKDVWKQAQQEVVKLVEEITKEVVEKKSLEHTGANLFRNLTLNELYLRILKGDEKQNENSN